MSRRHPIISVTGSSGAGTTTVRKTFESIFRREKINGAIVEGDAFHRYTRTEMGQNIEAAEFGDSGGEVWGVSHYRMRRSGQ